MSVDFDQALGNQAVNSLACSSSVGVWRGVTMAWRVVAYSRPRHILVGEAPAVGDDALGLEKTRDMARLERGALGRIGPVRLHQTMGSRPKAAKNSRSVLPGRCLLIRGAHQVMSRRGQAVGRLPVERGDQAPLGGHALHGQNARSYAKKMRRAGGDARMNPTAARTITTS